MPRVKAGIRRHQKHVKILKLAKGYRGARHRLFRKANEAVVRAGEHAFSGRKQRRRDVRRLWIARLSGALTKYQISYSRLIPALKSAKIEINRNMLAEMAITDPKGFETIINLAKQHIK